MADPAPTQPSLDPTGGGDPNPKAGEGGNPPAPEPKSGTQPAGDSIDLSKLPADQLNKVLENPELWNLPRIKELRESQANLKKLQDEQVKAGEKSLEDQKKFEELANKRGERVTQLETELQNNKIDQALTNKLVPEGVVDLEAALKLADRSKIKVDSNGNITGVDDALASLKTDKAYLFGKPGQPQVGGPTNPQNPPSGPAKFKRSQLRDPVFYQEHRDEILAAQKAGLIEDDIT